MKLTFVDALVAMEKAMKRDKIIVNDRQLACARITSDEGQDYLKGMAAAGNYAWVNRSSMTFLTRQVPHPASSLVICSLVICSLVICSLVICSLVICSLVTCSLISSQQIKA